MRIWERMCLRMRAICAVILCLSTGSVLIMLNKHIMSTLNFQYPLMISCLGMFNIAITVRLLAYFEYIHIRNEIRKLMTWSFYARHIGIIALMQACTLNFGNRVYLHLSVSLVQMLKAFTPVIVMGILWLSKQLNPTLHLLLSIVLLCVGTAITSTGVSETDQSFIGFLLMFGAIITEAINVGYSQKILQGLTIPNQKKQTSHDNNRSNITDTSINIVDSDNSDNSNDERVAFLASTDIGTSTGQSHQSQSSLVSSGGNSSNPLKKEHVEMISVRFSLFEGLYYFAPFASFWMCLLVLPIELPDFISNFGDNCAIIYSHSFKFFCAGWLGFGTKLSSWMVTQEISALYSKALLVFRNSCLVLFNVYFMGELVTSQQTFGYFISLIGFIAYNWLQFNGKANKLRTDQ